MPVSRTPGLSRREFLSAAGGALALASATGAARPHVWARSQPVHTTGDLEVLVVSDGHFFLPQGFLLTPDSPATERAVVLKNTKQPGDPFQLPNNVSVIKTRSHLILVDAGAGPRHQPTAGKLAAALRTAGIEPAAITMVVLTHGHPDHLWGVLDADDNRIYPNATFAISAREWELWSDPHVLQALPPALANDQIVSAATKHLARIKDKITTLRAGDDIVSGVRVIETRGHTQGHISLELTGGAGLIIGGDALTHPVISFQYPSWKVPVDHEPDQGVATRLRLLDRLATDKVRLLGAHLPVPGTGFVERKDDAYRFVPA